MILFGFVSTNAFAEGKDSNSSKCPNQNMSKLATSALNSLDLEVSQAADSLLKFAESTDQDGMSDQQISKDFEMTLTSLQAGKAAEELMEEFEEGAK